MWLTFRLHIKLFGKSFLYYIRQGGEHPQCESSRIFLLRTFSVKSILANRESQKWPPFWHVLKTSDLTNLIARKIWMAEKFTNFYTVGVHHLFLRYRDGLSSQTICHHYCQKYNLHVRYKHIHSVTNSHKNQFQRSIIVPTKVMFAIFLLRKRNSHSCQHFQNFLDLSS